MAAFIPGPRYPDDADPEGAVGISFAVLFASFAVERHLLHVYASNLFVADFL